MKAKRQRHSRQGISSCKGFTLVELLVAMGVSAIAMTLIGLSYWTQTQTSREQKLVLEMQQNMRSAEMMMKRDLRMAGFDLDNDSTFNAAGQNTLGFVYSADEDGIDNNGDGTADETGERETVQYSLFDSGVDADALADDLQRQAGGQSIAGNIDNMEFFYTMADGTQTLTPGNAADIRAVGVSILFRTESPTRSLDNATYRTLSGVDWGPFNDRFQRQIIRFIVQCRNMSI